MDIDRRTQHTALSRLSELEGYDVAEGSPDIRGWRVVDEAGREVGDVADLLVDTSSAEALYAAVDLEDGAEADVPIATILLDEQAEAVHLTEPLVTKAAGREAAFEAPATAEYADTAATAEGRDDSAVGPTRFDGPDRRKR